MNTPYAVWYIIMISFVISNVIFFIRFNQINPIEFLLNIKIRETNAINIKPWMLLHVILVLTIKQTS